MGITFVSVPARPHRLANEVFQILGAIFPKVLSLLFALLKVDAIAGIIKKAIKWIMRKIAELKQKVINLFKSKKRKCGKGCVKCKAPRKKMMPMMPRRGRGGIAGCSTGQCFVLAEDSRDGNGLPKLMGEHRMGQRIQTWLPGEVGYAESLSRPDEEIGPTTHRVVWFMQEFDDGHWKKFGLLRSVEWLSETGITEVGDWVDISELDEMGVEGEFQVMAIDPCPPIEPGPGRIITGEFHFSKGLVYNLRISGQEQPIRGTSQHPFFSADRDDWVPMAELRIGERLLAEGGTTVVLGLEESGEEPVCNIEVDGDHCYRVGASGVLVHNESAPCEDYCAKNGYMYVKKPSGYRDWTDYVMNACMKKSDPNVKKPHGHHIVMKGKFTESAEARQILCKYKINPFTNCRNLVVSRNYCHSKVYAQRVLKELKKADERFGTLQAIEQVLREMATYHMNCGDPGGVDEAVDDEN